MQFRFIHVADIHLGYEQYNLAQRADDFARAYLKMVEHAIDERVDFVLVAGDLFHRAQTDAWTLKQATAGLTMLRDARIPVVAIEGNHDAQHYHKHLSWLEFLCDQELLILLNVVRAPNGYASLVPFDPVERRGSFVDLAGARIYGLKYYGAATARIIEEIAGEIEPGEHGYTIMLLHAGMQGQVPNLHGGLTPAQLQPLRPAIDYLALGHVHKRLELDGWIFNPGSTETNSMEEMEWAHGFFDVRVDTTGPTHTVSEIETPSLRPFRRISVGAEGSRSVDDFVARVEEKIGATSGIPEGAIVELHLGGTAEFRRQDVPLERLKGEVESRFSPLAVRLRNNLVPPGIIPSRSGERTPRAELERQVVEHLVYQHPEYRDQAAAWARLILDIKNMAAEKTAPALVADHLRKALGEMAAVEPEPPPAVDREEPLAIGGDPLDAQPELDEW
jgi:DNA repair exonuclease SbcCD nuclease subunit